MVNIMDIMTSGMGGVTYAAKISQQDVCGCRNQSY